MLRACEMRRENLNKMKNMHFKISNIVLCISIICFIADKSESVYTTTCLDSLFRSGTKSPINIDSSKVIEANATKPLTLFNAIFDIVNLTNTGKTLDAYSNQLLDPSFITGGPLCGKKYKIYAIRFYINQNENKRSGNEVDGQGAPLEMTVIYYNILYGSMENALRFPDGITIVGFPVKVGLLPSVGFLPLQTSLLFDVVKKPHSSFQIPGLLVYIWFDNLLISPVYEYYYYSGNYYDPEAETQIPRAANYIFINPEQALTLSKIQFEAFTQVLGLNGKPLNSAPPIYPQGSTKVYKYIGIKQVLLPVA